MMCWKSIKTVGEILLLILLFSDGSASRQDFKSDSRNSNNKVSYLFVYFVGFYSFFEFVLCIFLFVGNFVFLFITIRCIIRKKGIRRRRKRNEEEEERTNKKDKQK